MSSTNKSSNKRKSDAVTTPQTQPKQTTNNNENKKLKQTTTTTATPTKPIVTTTTQTNNKINIKEINDIFNMNNTTTTTTTSNNNNNVIADSWDGESPIENLTIGQLISSLNGRQHQLRIIVAEYMNSLNRLTGFTEKTPYLLNWVLDNLSKSFLNWKQPEKAEQLISKNIEPLLFETRYWTLLDNLVVKQITLQQQQTQQIQLDSTTTSNTTTTKLSNDYLQFIFEIILNSIRNLDLKLNIFEDTNTNTNTTTTTTTSSSKKKKNINIPYQLTKSPPPPIKFFEYSKRITIQFIKIYSSDELMKEIPLLLESLIPLFIKYLRNGNDGNQEFINSIFDLFQTLFNYLLIQTKLGINYKSMFTTILTTLLPHILTLVNALENVPPTTTTSKLSETIDELLKWSFYHPDSHWDSYPFILFSGWLKKIVKDKTTTTTTTTTTKDPKDSKDSKKSTKKGKGKEKGKEKEIETVSTPVDSQIYQPQLILDRLLQLISNGQSVTTTNSIKPICFNENQDISSIVVNSLYKFLEYFIEQYENHGYRHFKDITQWYESGNHKDEKFIEFAYFRKLFGCITPSVLSSNPKYYSAAAKLLNQVSTLNIFHINNRYQVDYLSNTVGKSYYSLLSTSGNNNNNNNNDDRIKLNGVYKCLTSLIKISNTLIGNKLKDVILPHVWSSSNDNNGVGDESTCEFLKSTFDSYFEIRQMDTLLTMIFQSIISVRSFGSDCKSSFSSDLFLQHISKLFSNLPFGQVPIIWSLFLEEYQGYYISQLNESTVNFSDEDESMADPMFSYRLEKFITIWSCFLDSITISSFVYKMILQLLPNTYQSVVDPIVNEIYNKSNSNNCKILNLLKLYSSFLQVHSFIHRQTIITGENGENEYAYHPQQFYYFEKSEKELEFSKVIEYLIEKFANGKNNNNNNDDTNQFEIKSITSKLLIQRVQQLHSILSSVSVTNFKRLENPNKSYNPSTDKINHISSLINQKYSPSDIESELVDIVYYLLSNFNQLVSENNLLFKQQQQQSSDQQLNLAIYQCKLLISNISTWCEYSTTENIQNILKFIISPPEINNQVNGNGGNGSNTIYKLFQKLLSNPLFFELKVFQNNFPIVLCQMERDIITKELIKSSKLFENVTEIFKDVQERLINSGTLTPSNTSYAEIITEIQECFSKRISSKDFNISDSSKWDKLTWLVSLAPSFHPLYIPIELIGPLVLSSIVINHIGVLLLKQPSTTTSTNSSSEQSIDYIYKLILSSRRFIKFCFEKDQSRLVQIIPMNIWIDLIFSSRMFESIDTKYPILFTSLEIQHHYNSELWKHSPMELKKLADKIMSKKTTMITQPTITSPPLSASSTLTDISTIKPYLIAGILKSISYHTTSDDHLPPDLQTIIKSVEPDIKLFFDKMYKHCSVDTSFSNVAPFLNEYQAEFSLLVYHLWYQLYHNATDDESLSKLLIVVSISGVFISGLSNEIVGEYSLILQNSIISLLDLFSRWYSKINSSTIQSSLMIDSIHALSLLVKMLSCYPEDSKLHKLISTAIIQFFQLNNQLGYLLNSITTTIENSNLNQSTTIAIQSQSFALLGYFISSIVGTKRISLLKNPVKLVTCIVNVLNSTNSEPLIVSGINLLCKLMSINVIDVNGDCIPIILAVMDGFSSPFIYSTPLKSIASFNTEIISNCPMALFIKEDSTNNFGNGLKFNNITPQILNSIYKLLYIILKFRNNELSKYISSFVSSLRFLLYSISNESNRLLINNEKSIKKVGRLLEVFSMNKNCDLYFQYLIVDYVQLVRYSTTALNINNNNNNNSTTITNKKQYVGPQYHLSVEMRNLLLPGIFSLVEKSNSNSNKELFQSLEDTGKGIFQNIISQYQSFKYTGK